MTSNFSDVATADGRTREVLTELEVSEWLGLSQPTLSRHRRNGTGPAFIRLSTRRIGYRRSAVETWLTKLERSSVA
jgi:predicted DNA-binding transcriptional regulator AlpA